VLEAHLGAAPFELPGAAAVGDFPVGAHQAEHALDVGEGLADLPVQHAEEVERHVELDQEGVDQHQVAEGHAPFGHARAARHIIGDAHGDDRRLAHVEIRRISGW
jgi:hypothetical protein